MKKYSGTTVNERLYLSGLMAEFDKAVFEKNYNKAKEILEKVELTEESISPILKSLGISSPDTDNTSAI